MEQSFNDLSITEAGEELKELVYEKFDLFKSNLELFEEECLSFVSNYKNTAVQPRRSSQLFPNQAILLRTPTRISEDSIKDIINNNKSDESDKSNSPIPNNNNSSNPVVPPNTSKTQIEVTMDPNSETWKCLVCEYDNYTTENSCILCSEPRPMGNETPSTIPNLLSSSNLLENVDMGLEIHEEDKPVTEEMNSRSIKYVSQEPEKEDSSSSSDYGNNNNNNIDNIKIEKFKFDNNTKNSLGNNLNESEKRRLLMSNSPRILDDTVHDDPENMELKTSSDENDFDGNSSVTDSDDIVDMQIEDGLYHIVFSQYNSPNNLSYLSVDFGGITEDVQIVPIPYHTTYRHRDIFYIRYNLKQQAYSMRSLLSKMYLEMTSDNKLVQRRRDKTNVNQFFYMDKIEILSAGTEIITIRTKNDGKLLPFNGNKYYLINYIEEAPDDEDEEQIRFDYTNKFRNWIRNKFTNDM